jgi:hypothetical protein
MIEYLIMMRKRDEEKRILFIIQLIKNNVQDI